MAWCGAIVVLCLTDRLSNSGHLPSGQLYSLLLLGVHVMLTR